MSSGNTGFISESGLHRFVGVSSFFHFTSNPPTEHIFFHNLALIDKDEQGYYSPTKSVILSNTFLLDHE